jgi:hypothetical protein
MQPCFRQNRGMIPRPFRFFALLLFSLSSGAAPLPVQVQNASFEQNAATLIPNPGSFTANNIPQWVASGSGLFRPDVPVNFAPDGVAVVFLDNGGNLSQLLIFPGGAAVTAVPGARLTVNLLARPRSVTGNCSMVFDARVGGVSVAQTTGILPLAANATGYSAVSSSIPLKNAAGLGGANGQPLALFISSSGDQANIDQISCTIAYPPVINALSADPQPATAGEPVTISWNVTGATALTFNGSDATGQTSAVISAPATAQSYTLTATNGDGVTAGSIPVDVVPASLQLNTGIHIAEILSNNVNGLTDEDGAHSDWIEIVNDTGVAASLAGWTLTDDRAVPAKWTFPATIIAPGGHLLVWASGKNRAVAGQPLHTNFRLDADGEYLALRDAEGVPHSIFSPLPPQPPDVSYGFGQGPVAGQYTTLTGPATNVKWHVPAAPVSDAWRGAAEPFADGSWNDGQWPMGFDLNSYAAYSVVAGTAGIQNFSGALGLDFDVVRDIEVTQLGCFDHQSNGIAAGVTITVQLWRRSGVPAALDIDPLAAGMQTGLTFTQASGGTAAGGQRFKSLTAPVALAQGQYTIVAYGYGAAELNGNVNGTTLFPVTTNSAAGAIAFVGSGRWGNTQGAFPPNPDGGPAARYGAGTFVFKEAGGAPFVTDTSAAMFSVNAGVLTRSAFELSELPDCPVLHVTSDDGFLAWINGMEVARRHAPAALTHDAAATGAGTGTTSVALGGFAGLLHTGTNVLAIQGLNVSASDPDFRLSAELSAQETAEGLRVFFHTPTPGMANGSGTLATHLLISEIHCDPSDGKVQFTEFVELYNPLPVPVDAGGWSITGAVDFTIPPGTVVQPCGHLVIAENPAHAATYLNFTGALGPWSGSLRNEGDEIVLRDAALKVVDRVNYEQGFPWPTVGDFPGRSMQRIHPGMASNLGASWRSGPPTPGADNSTLTGTPPPAIRQVAHAPAAPVSGDPVTVTAKVDDPDSIAGVWLEYQIVEPGSYIRLTDPQWSTSWTALPMNDAGTGGDAAAGDDIYSVVIPGSVQSHRRLIRYRLRAWDGSLNHVRVPYADDDSANFACFCYDGVPSWTGAVQPGVTAAATFPEATMRKVRAWHLLANATDVQNCQYNAAFNDGTYRFEGAIVIGDKVYDHVRYRVKGQNSTFNTGKNKWKFRFNRGRLLEMPDDYGLRTTTVRTLNISSVPSSWAPWNRGMHGLDEAMAYRLSELAGVPAPRTSYLQWRVIDGAQEANPASQFDGDLWGLYLAFENTDNYWKDEHDLPDGTGFRLIGNETGNHVLGQGRGMPSNLSDLNAFTSASTGYRLGGGTATVAPPVSAIQPASWFRENVDLPAYCSWRAVTEAINQTDRREQENVVYFRRPPAALGGDGRWMIIPWDCDLLYENFDRWGPQSVQTAANLQQYEQIGRCLLHPEILTEFQNRACELQDLLLNSDQAWKLVDEFISIITDEAPRIIPDGGPISDGFVEVERRRWDYNPSNPTTPRGAGPAGNYYKSPYPIGNMTNGPFPQPYNRVLPGAEFEGMVKWIKDFIVGSNNGGARLARMAKGEIAPYTLTATPPILIPATPVIVYSGHAGFALNQLQFTSSGFSSPNGQTFAAMQWRIGEIHDPSVPQFTAGTPWRYEIEGVWTPVESAAFNAVVNPPATGLVAGRTYRARVKHKDSAGRWSHWSEPLEFQAGPAIPGDLAANLVVSEIMYNPPAPEGGDAEFIELMNIHPGAPLDLTGVQFTGGISFSFLPGTMLNSGARLVLVRNPDVFAAKYPGVTIGGNYSGSLDNAGEQIVLSLGGGAVLRDFTYDNDLPWPAEPDNGGSSLVLLAPHTNPDHGNPLNWRASFSPNPGTGDATPFTGTPGEDTDHDGLDELLEYFFGSSPAVPSNSVMPVLLRQSDGSALLTFTKSLTADDLAWELQSSGDASNWSAATAALISRSSSAAGETFVFAVPATAFNERRRYWRLRVWLR